MCCFNDHNTHLRPIHLYRHTCVASRITTHIWDIFIYIYIYIWHTFDVYSFYISEGYRDGFNFSWTQTMQCLWWEENYFVPSLTNCYYISFIYGIIVSWLKHFSVDCTCDSELVIVQIKNSGNEVKYGILFSLVRLNFYNLNAYTEI